MVRPLQITLSVGLLLICGGEILDKEPSEVPFIKPLIMAVPPFLVTLPEAGGAKARTLIPEMVS